MSNKHLLRKKRRRQAKIIVALMMIALVFVILLLGFLIFEFVWSRVIYDRFFVAQSTHISEDSQSSDKIDSDTSMIEITVPTEQTVLTEETIVEMIWPVAMIPDNVEGPDLSGYLVVIDPGHQQSPNTEQEPIAPWMSGSKDKSSQGAVGVVTSRPEYDLNLALGLVLRDYLNALNCDVQMTRLSSNVDMSNIERAQYATSLQPDIYIRLYCAEDEDSSMRGISIFVADTGPHAHQLSVWSDELGLLLSELTESEYLGCIASSRFTGLNWANEIPSFMVRMGYLSNAEDDVLLSDPDYQLSICQAIAEFVALMPRNTSRSG